MNIEVFKETKDNWHNTYLLYSSTRRLVRMRISQLNPAPATAHRVGVWGDDDYGFIRDFDTLEAALEVFYVIVGMSQINKEDLIDLGFVMF